MEPPVAPEKLTVPLLRAQLQARGLPTNGLKAELVSRLQTALDAEACSADMAVDAAPAAPAAAAPAAVAEPEPMDAAAQASAPAPVVAPAADAAAAAVAEPPSTVARAAAAQPVAAPAPQPAQAAAPPAQASVPAPKPVAAPRAAAAKEEAKKEQARGGGALTVRELLSDRLMKAADETWRLPGGKTKPLDDALVAKMYEEELGGGSRAPSSQRASVLEISQYLELYLWPHFKAEEASVTHVLSIMLMVNEKFRENMPGWTCFTDADKFAAFFKRVVALKSERALSVVEQTAYLIFMINVFQSLENETIRAVALPLVSLPLWHALSSGRLQLELAQHPQLEKHWRYLQRKEAKAAKQPGHVPIAQQQQVVFLPNLVDEFLAMLPAAVTGAGAVDAAKLAYCERFMEFLIDLLSQLPTRRFVRTVLEDRAVLVKCRLAPLFGNPRGRLFSQLVDLYRFYQGFEINDHTGAQLTDDEVAAAHYERLQQLQRLAFKHIPALRELALSNCGSIEKRPTLMRHLQALQPEDLARLATRQLRLASPDDPWAADPRFLLEVLVSALEKRRSQRQTISEMPLYPNEEVLWDENVVPSIAYTGEGCLALPKLNLQFLTFHDYLLRNFNLFRLEATYEIREDLADVLGRIGPVAHPEAEGRVLFTGWARMAVPPTSVTIVEVRKPNVGEAKPSAVTAEIKFDLATLRPPVRAEWDELRQHDVLFLLGILPPTTADPSAPIMQRSGLQHVRGCEVIELRDAEGKLMNDFTGRNRREQWTPPKGTERTLLVALDTAQYQIDITRQVEASGPDVYAGLNLLVRRKPKENNFKAILDCIRDLMGEDTAVPGWLHDIFLGYGDPAAAQYRNMPEAVPTLDFKDTFLDAAHLEACFPGRAVEYTNVEPGAVPVPPFRVTFPELQSRGDAAATGKRKTEGDEPAADGSQEPLRVEAYIPPDPGPYPEDQPRQNTVRFTPVQAQAVLSGLQPGLTMLVGPPGTGKTDTAVQILHTLYHNYPNQRTLVITHSNAALNDLFQKLMERDVPARYLLRLGMGEAELDTDLDFSRQGRVNAMLARRLELLTEVERLARTLGVPDDVAYTCETAAHFWLLHVLARWEAFVATVARAGDQDAAVVAGRFPFSEFFANAPQPLFEGRSTAADMRKARGCFRHLKVMFTELEECRAFELLKGQADRGNYLLTRQAKVVAMTCTHAALKRRDFVRLGFKYDNLLMEESAQILEIETFIPMLLQRSDDGVSRLKRVVLIGDHHQLPPVVKNVAFQKYCHMDQSLFTRFVRLGTPYIELNAQGRARPSMASLYNWRYRQLGDLPSVSQGAYAHANAGFAHTMQFVDVPDFDGYGEMEPTPHFVQNLGEAEYLVSVFQYMRLLGYPAHKISIITTYRGQKHLIRDVIARRCASHPLFGRPAAVTTVDKFQGQQNDFILLSLVRTRIVGHLRDVRRLVVAMSRARLGLYVFGRQSLFAQCYELQPAFTQLLQNPTRLALVPTEQHPTQRLVGDAVTPYLVDGLGPMGALVNTLATRWQQAQLAQLQQGSEAPPAKE